MFLKSLSKKKILVYLFILIFGISLIILILNIVYKTDYQKNLNIILITIDCLRSDCLSCYGYPKKISPAIDEIAESGIKFSNAISQETWTWPSIHSILTSTYPSTHKIYFYDAILSPKAITLSSILKKLGYKTGFVSAHGGMNSLRDGFGRDFDFFTIGDYRANNLTEIALAWMGNIISDKFFLWLHYMDTHESFLGVSEENKRAESMNKEEIDKFKNKYVESIEEIDNQISNILKFLKRKTINKNTVLIITADHGNELGEHGYYFNHGGLLWDSVIKVPLILFNPEVETKNKVVPYPVQLIDIAPTICDLLRIKIPISFEGASLLSLKNEDYNRFVYCEHVQMNEFLSSNQIQMNQFAVRTNEWKLVLTQEKNLKNFSLFNLKSDPFELDDIKEQEIDTFNLMKENLIKWISRPKKNMNYKKTTLDKNAEERLKALGYLK